MKKILFLLMIFLISCTPEYPYIEIIDADYDSKSSGYNLDMKLDNEDNIHICYTFYPNNNVCTLKYATNASGAWKKETIETGYSFTSPSIALDSSSNVYICYNSGKLATNKSGNWSIETIGTEWIHNDMLIDSNDKIHIVYDNETSLKYFTNSSGSWEEEIIEDNDYIPSVISAELDSNDKIHIAYGNGSGISDTKCLKYATNASGSWAIETIKEENRPFSTVSIAIDKNNNIHICSCNLDFEYITNISGNWIIKKIDNDDNDSYFKPSITTDENNKVHISYYSDTDVRYITNKGNEWKSYLVELNYDSGINSAIAVSNDSIYICFNSINKYYRESYLKYAWFKNN